MPNRRDTMCSRVKTSKSWWYKVSGPFTRHGGKRKRRPRRRVGVTSRDKRSVNTRGVGRVPPRCQIPNIFQPPPATEPLRRRGVLVGPSRPVVRDVPRRSNDASPRAHGPSGALRAYCRSYFWTPRTHETRRDCRRPRFARRSKLALSPAPGRAVPRVLLPRAAPVQHAPVGRLLQNARFTAVSPSADQTGRVG